MQAPQVELQAGEEEQHRQPQDAENLDGRIDLDQPQDVGADEDPGDDLQDDGREREPGDEPEKQRRRKRDRHDGEEVGERRLHPPQSRGRS